MATTTSGRMNERKQTVRKMREPRVPHHKRSARNSPMTTGEIVPMITQMTWLKNALRTVALPNIST
jgi:hypothetical protein